MLLLFLVFLNFNAIFASEEDSFETRYIDLLPEDEKKEFIQRITRRIIEEVETKKNGSQKSGEVPDSQLQQHASFVEKLLREESDNLRRRRAFVKTKRSTEAQGRDNKKNIGRKLENPKESIDLTLRHRNETLRTGDDVDGIDLEEDRDVKYKVSSEEMQVYTVSKNNSDKFNKNGIKVSTLYDGEDSNEEGDIKIETVTTSNPKNVSIEIEIIEDKDVNANNQKDKVPVQVIYDDANSTSGIISVTTQAKENSDTNIKNTTTRNKTVKKIQLTTVETTTSKATTADSPITVSTSAQSTTTKSTTTKPTTTKPTTTISTTTELTTDNKHTSIIKSKISSELDDQPSEDDSESDTFSVSILAKPAPDGKLTTRKEGNITSNEEDDSHVHYNIKRNLNTTTSKVSPVADKNTRTNSTESNGFPDQKNFNLRKNGQRNDKGIKQLGAETTIEDFNTNANPNAVKKDSKSKEQTSIPKDNDNISDLEETKDNTESESKLNNLDKSFYQETSTDIIDILVIKHNQHIETKKNPSAKNKPSKKILATATKESPVTTANHIGRIIVTTPDDPERITQNVDSSTEKVKSSETKLNSEISEYSEIKTKKLVSTTKTPYSTEKSFKSSKNKHKRKIIITTTTEYPSSTENAGLRTKTPDSTSKIPYSTAETIESTETKQKSKIMTKTTKDAPKITKNEDLTIETLYSTAKTIKIKQKSKILVTKTTEYSNNITTNYPDLTANASESSILNSSAEKLKSEKNKLNSKILVNTSGYRDETIIIPDLTTKTSESIEKNVKSPENKVQSKTLIAEIVKSPENKVKSKTLKAAKTEYPDISTTNIHQSILSTPCTTGITDKSKLSVAKDKTNDIECRTEHIFWPADVDKTTTQHKTDKLDDLLTRTEFISWPNSHDSTTETVIKPKMDYVKSKTEDTSWPHDVHKATTDRFDIIQTKTKFFSWPDAHDSTTEAIVQARTEYISGKFDTDISEETKVNQGNVLNQKSKSDVTNRTEKLSDKKTVTEDLVKARTEYITGKYDTDLPEESKFNKANKTAQKLQLYLTNHPANWSDKITVTEEIVKARTVYITGKYDTDVSEETKHEFNGTDQLLKPDITNNTAIVNSTERNIKLENATVILMEPSEDDNGYDSEMEDVTTTPGPVLTTTAKNYKRQITFYKPFMGIQNNNDIEVINEGSTKKVHVKSESKVTHKLDNNNILRYDPPKMNMKEYRVYEVPPEENPFVPNKIIQKVKLMDVKDSDILREKQNEKEVYMDIDNPKNEQINYVPVYNYAPENAYFNPANKFGLNEPGVFVDTVISEEKDLHIKGKKKYIFTSIENKDSDIILREKQNEQEVNMDTNNTKNEQINYVPVYNYAPENAYFNPANKFAPNEPGLFVDTVNSEGKDLQIKGKKKYIFTSIENKDSDNILREKQNEQEVNMDINNSKNEQINYVPVYNYAPENAYFNPANKFAPNEPGLFVDTVISEEKDLQIKSKEKDIFKSIENKNYDIQHGAKGVHNKELDVFFGVTPLDKHNLRQCSSEETTERVMKKFPNSNSDEHAYNALLNDKKVKNHLQQVKQMLHNRNYFEKHIKGKEDSVYSTIYPMMPPFPTTKTTTTTKNPKKKLLRNNKLTSMINKSNVPDKTFLNSLMLLLTNNIMNSNDRDNSKPGDHIFGHDIERDDAREILDKPVPLVEYTKKRMRRDKPSVEYEYYTNPKDVSSDDEDTLKIRAALQRVLGMTIKEMLPYLINKHKNKTRAHHRNLNKTMQQVNKTMPRSWTTWPASRYLAPAARSFPRNEVDGFAKLELQSYVQVIQDMVKMDNIGLERYDWLTSSVDIRTAIKKMISLCETLRSGEYIHPRDLQLIKYMLYLFKSSENLLQAEPKIPILYRRSGRRSLLPVSERPWLVKPNDQELLNKFEDFWMGVEYLLDDLHDAMKHIALITRFKHQNWFKNLKELYLTNATRKQALEILLHLSARNIILLVENSAKGGMEDNYVKYAMANNLEIEATKDEMSFLVQVFNELKKEL